MIEGLVVSVGYADYLALTLPRAMEFLSGCVVVTDFDDAATKTLCRGLQRVKCLQTDAFYARGSAFCKSAAVAIGRRMLEGADWALLWDADIWIEGVETVDLTALDQCCLYAPRDKHHLAYGETGSNMHHDGAAAAGFFQLVHSSTLREKGHPVTSSDASTDDILFSLQFGLPQRLESVRCYHLGPRSADGEPNVNWSGRKSAPSPWTVESVREAIACS